MIMASGSFHTEWYPGFKKTEKNQYNQFPQHCHPSIPVHRFLTYVKKAYFSGVSKEVRPFLCPPIGYIETIEQVQNRE